MSAPIRIQRRSQSVERLCADADELALGAQRAAQAGDMVAFVELISAAAGLVKIAKALESATPPPRRAGDA